VLLATAESGTSTTVVATTSERGSWVGSAEKTAVDKMKPYAVHCRDQRRARNLAQAIDWRIFKPKKPRDVVEFKGHAVFDADDTGFGGDHFAVGSVRCASHLAGVLSFRELASASSKMVSPKPVSSASKTACP